MRRAEEAPPAAAPDAAPPVAGPSAPAESPASPAPRSPAGPTAPLPQALMAAAAHTPRAAPRAPTGLAATLRGLWRLGRALLHGLHGLVVVLVVFPWLGLPARQARIRWWAGKMFRMLGMRLQVAGQFRPGAKLLVANHLSWLDIMAVHAACPEARFVSKAEVRHWPLVNRLVDAARTLYLQRERARDALRVVHEMAEALRQGDTVAVFPEGTTGDGHALLPFHANLLQAAISTATPVQPVALRFADADGPVSAAADFTGDITLMQSLWALARARSMVVHLQVLAAVGTSHADRRALAERLRQLIDDALSVQRGV